MPLYAYTCESGHDHELRLQVSDRYFPPPCPTCGAALKRQYASPRINMRGATSGDEITEWQFANLDDRTWSKGRWI